MAEQVPEVGADHDAKSFLAGETSPVFFGSALTNFGVRKLLDAVSEPVVVQGHEFRITACPSVMGEPVACTTRSPTARLPGVAPRFPASKKTG